MRWVIAFLAALLVLGIAVIAVLNWSQPAKKTAKPRYSGGIAVKIEGQRSGKKKSGLGSSTKTAGLAAVGNRQSGFGAEFSPENLYEEGEVVVLDPPKAFRAKASQLGFSVVETVELEELSLLLYRLRIPPGSTVPQARRLLRGRFPGLTMDANHLFETQEAKTSSQPHFKAHVRSLVGWNNYPDGCGKGIRLGMIDAGVDVKHSALTGQKVEFRSFHKKGRKPGPADHGTAVATIIVGKPEWGGLLPGAELKAANMFEVNESGRIVGNSVALLKAINWMAKTKVAVVNLSIAGTDNSVVRVAFNKARQKGLVMVAAAGNWGSGSKPAYPAAYEHVVAVTAFNDRKLIYTRANTGKYIDFAAPGVHIWTAVPGGGRFQSGTSFASPYIAVLMALEIAKGGGKSLNSLRGIMQRNIVDMGAPGKDQVFGWGFVHKAAKCR